MAQSDSEKVFLNGGMDTDSAPEYISPNDFREAINFRFTGTSKGEAGYGTDIESAIVVTESPAPPTGILKTIGAQEFPDINKAPYFRYNSAGFNQLMAYDYATNTTRAIYTDLTDSANVPLLPLDPQFYVNSILLMNQEYLVWTDGKSTVGFTNFTKLSSSGYGTLIAEDFSLIKPQCLAPIIGAYSSDPGKASNFCKSKLFQFNVQYVGQEYTYSAWSTWSKRVIPSTEATPAIGTDVTQNNCIVLQVPVGSIRVQTLNIAARYGAFNFNIIKTVDRAYILLLPNTAVNIPSAIYEAYDPSTGLYSFVFYNDSIALPVPPVDTDLAYDHVPLIAGAVESINGDIIALGDCTEGYMRPAISVTVKAVGYDPNLTVPTASNPNPLRIVSTFPGAVRSGEGNHRRRINVVLGGSPAENDVLTFITADIRNASSISTYTYTVPAGSVGNLEMVSSDMGQQIPNSNSNNNGDETFTITWVDSPYFELQSATITLFNAGPTVSKSIHGVLDNSSYQLARRYRDGYGRYFPLDTTNADIIKTPSFAQLNGQAVKISWTINNAAAPTGAVDYQWMITPNNTTSKVLDVLGNIIHYISVWNSNTNSPLLAANTGTVGDTYQIEQPTVACPANLGNGITTYNTGDYIVYNGKSWDVVPKAFGNLTSTGNILAFKIEPLALFNQRYTNSGANTVLNYDFSDNDRCTLHAKYTIGVPTYFNNPCIELSVLGYDATTNLVKVGKSSSLDPTSIAGLDVYMRLWSPKAETQADTSTSTETVWFEIGERFTITNGLHDVLTGDITDGDVYFKTRTYQGAVDPSTDHNLLATDFNFSDFYDSAFSSYGRPGAYNDELEATERKAIMRHSQNFILGSRNNGLTRFFAEAIYGESDGQTSSSLGAIQVMKMRGRELIIVQERGTGYIPVNVSILEDAAQQRQYAISEKLFNNIDYSRTPNIGCGTAKESFWWFENHGGFIDPYKGAPMQLDVNGLTDISYKMSKYFKEAISTAYAEGRKLFQYYDRYYKEVIFATETLGGVLTVFSFSPLNWNILDDYEPALIDITPSNGSHSTVGYNNTTGLATYTPTTDYVGNDTAPFTFTIDGNPTTKNVCLSWTAGSPDVFSFSFIALINQALTTLVYSYSILVFGNTIPAPISVTWGEYSINLGSFTSVAGTVNAGDTVIVRQTTSGSYNTLTTATLTIDGQSAPFNATTLTTAPGLEVIVTIGVADGGEELRMVLSEALECSFGFTVFWTAMDYHGLNTRRSQGVSFGIGVTVMETTEGHGGDTVICVDMLDSIYKTSCGGMGSVIISFALDVGSGITYCDVP